MQRTISSVCRREKFILRTLWCARVQSRASLDKACLKQNKASAILCLKKKKKVKRKNWEKKQMEHDLEGEYCWRWMLSKTFVLKTFLPNHKKLCQWLHKLMQSKLWIYSNQLQPNFGFMYSFTTHYTYVSIAKEFC